MRCWARGLTARCAPPRPVIRAINQCGRPVFALDIPSGLDGDSGTVRGEEAVRADATVTFVGLKTGLFLGDGPEFAGTIFFDDLEIVPARSAQPVPSLTRIVESEIHEALPQRKRAANKGDFGRVLIVGGGAGMPGAARLAGEACLRVGAGLVTVAVAPENVAAIAGGRPELICVALTDAACCRGPGAGGRGCDRAGPGAFGLGKQRADRGARCGQAAGDGCGCAQPACRAGRCAAREDWILTPHPGEAGAAARGQRPGGTGGSARRAGAPRSRAIHGTVVLKGAGTLVGCAWPASRGCASAAIPAWQPPARAMS